MLMIESDHNSGFDAIMTAEPNMPTSGFRSASRAASLGSAEDLNVLIMFSIVIGTMTNSISHYDNREGLLALLTEPGRYPLEMRDDSMVESGIYRGDTLVVQSQRHAASGDIVVALIDNERVALKRIRFVDGDRIELISDHPALDRDLLARSRVEIQGKVIGQIRRYA